MPWDLPIAILTGFENPVTDWVIDTNQTDLNLYDYTGNQPEVQEYNVTVNAGVDIDTMELGGFPAGCIINFTLLGRIRGRGGLGGEGAWAQGEPETGGIGSPGWAVGPGADPESGENALVLAPAVTFRLDADVGYIWGGGGGGGGGRSIVDNDGAASGGGGGGGGRGWNTSAGGVGGEATGFSSGSGQDGGDGTASGSGSGGTSPSVFGTQGSPGGNGGEWGTDGGTEAFVPSSSNPNGVFGISGTAVPGGAAGKAIDINGATLQFVGAKGEATLISEGRLRGPVT